MVKGLKIDDELETGNLDKSGDELETIDLVRMFDLETPNQLKAKHNRRGANTATAREIGKAARADKLTERIERAELNGSRSTS